MTPSAPPQGDGEEPFALGAAPAVLPPRTYALANAPEASVAFQATLGWALGSYRFTRYKAASAPGKDAKPVALLAPAANAAAAEVARIAAGVYLGRDLINTPANDLGPAELEAAAEALARAHGGTLSSIVGDALLSAPGGGYPLIHAVGRAATAERAPRLLDLRWGREDAPRVTLVGKGVCFDTGGLDSACLPDDSAMHACAFAGTTRLTYLPISCFARALMQRAMLSYFLPCSQAREQHGEHEERHGRRGDCAFAGVDADGCQRAHPPARAHPRRGEQRGGRRLPPG